MQSPEVIRYYQRLVQSRKRGALGDLVSADHKVDWNDAPSKFTTYPQATRLPLSSSVNCRSLELGVRGRGRTKSNSPFITAEELSDFLLLSFGILRRNLAINWNVDSKRVARHRNATFSRGTASAGGLYPVEVYLISRCRAVLPTGIYHYDVGHHAIERLRVGNSESAVSLAIDNSEFDSSDILFVLTTRFWKTVFKYHNFGYQLVSQDSGAALGSMEQVAYALGWDTTVIYWFEDRRIAAVLGLEIDEEAPFAVLAVTGSGDREKRERDTQEGNDFCSTLALKRTQVYERSKKVFVPDLLRRVHGATLLDKVERPTLDVSNQSTNSTVGGYPTVRGDLYPILRRRETSWGRFCLAPAVGREALMQILSFVANGVQYKTDLSGCHTALSLLRFFLIARNVESLAEGVYEYSVSTDRLSARSTKNIPTSFQSVYFLQNFNLDQISSMLVITGKLDAALETLGARGFRVMNAEAGMAAQRAYLASTALSLGCGAVAGFDARQIAGITATDEKSEIPLLLIFLGNQLPDACGYQFHLD
jgi:SagB-type dehydrogenase family enzyme